MLSRTITVSRRIVDCRPTPEKVEILEDTLRRLLHKFHSMAAACCVKYIADISAVSTHVRIDPSLSSPSILVQVSVRGDESLPFEDLMGVIKQGLIDGFVPIGVDLFLDSADNEILDKNVENSLSESLADEGLRIVTEFTTISYVIRTYSTGYKTLFRSDEVVP